MLQTLVTSQSLSKCNTFFSSPSFLFCTQYNLDSLEPFICSCHKADSATHSFSETTKPNFKVYHIEIYQIQTAFYDLGLKGTVVILIFKYPKELCTQLLANENAKISVTSILRRQKNMHTWRWCGLLHRT